METVNLSTLVESTNIFPEPDYCLENNLLENQSTQLSKPNGQGYRKTQYDRSRETLEIVETWYVDDRKLCNKYSPLNQSADALNTPSKGSKVH